MGHIAKNLKLIDLIWFEKHFKLVQYSPPTRERAGLVWKALCSNWSLQIFSTNQEWAALVWCVQAARVPEMVGHDGADTFKEALHLPQGLTLSSKNKIDNTIVKF